MTLRISLLLILLSAQLADAQDISHDPNVAVDHLETAEGLEVSLFAAEPQLVNPAAMDVDHRGRVWVCEIVNYRRKAGMRPKGDRIVILSDTNGDGRADETQVFYQGKDLISPHGICVLATPDGKGTRAFVSVGSRVVVFTDDDGDDRADRQENLFTGIAGTQHDHGVHAFVFGPDGRFYFNCGNEAQEYRDAAGNSIRDLRGNLAKANRKPYQNGMVFRSNLDGSRFETLGWNFRNPWMVTVDSYGNVWQSDNDDDGYRGCRINFVSELGNYGYHGELTGSYWQQARNGQAQMPARHWHVNDPGVTPSVLYTGAGSPAGITIYEGDQLSEKLGGTLLHCDPGTNEVRCYQLSQNGAGFAAESSQILFSKTDQWFRPVDVKVAPDGSLIVADWYDPGVGGHHMGDVQRGRLFRVAPRGQSGEYRVPEYDFGTPEDAVAALSNPNFAVRAVAWQQLWQFGQGAEAPLAKLWKSQNSVLRARALWLLEIVAAEPSRYLEFSLKDPDPQIRIVGLRLARQLGQNMLPWIEKLINDPSPQVQHELAIALAYEDSNQADQLWARLATHYKRGDRWLLEALGSSADGKWDERLAAFEELTSREYSTPEAKDLIWRSRATATPALLARLIREASGSEESVDRYFRALEFQKEHEQQVALKSLLQHDAPLSPEIVAAALEQLPEATLADYPSARTSLDAFLDANQGSLRYHYFVRRFQLTERRDEVLHLFANAPDLSVADQATQTLGSLKAWAEIIALAESLDVQFAEGIELLGRFENAQINRSFLKHVKNDSLDVKFRTAAARGLTRSPSGQQSLLKLVRQGELPERFLFTAANALLGSSQPAIRQEATKLIKLPESANASSLPPIQQLQRERGDTLRGKAIFAGVGTCSNCHKVDGVGKEVGPDLSEIGSKLARMAMYESILDPSAGINHNYQQYLLVTDSGKIASGLLMNKTDQEVTIRNEEGIDQTYPMDKVEKLEESDQSLMPAGLQKLLTKQQLVDLIEYLMTLRKS